MTTVLVLLPTSTYRAHDFLVAAAAIGVDAVIGSEEPQALGGTLVLDLDDPEQAARQVDEWGRSVDAVVAVDDASVLAGAAIAARLGLRHNPREAVAATRDKAKLRRALDAAGVPQPAWTVLRPGDVPATYPAVLKPPDLSGSRGVIRVDDERSARAAAARIRAITGRPDGPLLAERFVPGPEVAVEALLRPGGLEVLAVFDKPDPLDGPYFEETIYVTPSRYDPGPLAAVTARATAALGLVDGPVHAEVRLGPDGPVVIEVAARSIGGLCSRALRFGLLGASLEEILLRHAAGLPLEHLQRERAATGVMMLPIPKAGTLEAVLGEDDARRVPGVVGLEITIAKGRPVVPLPDGDRYLGFLFARGATAAEVEAALREGFRRLEIVIT